MKIWSVHQWDEATYKWEWAGCHTAKQKATEAITAAVATRAADRRPMTDDDFEIAESDTGALDCAPGLYLGARCTDQAPLD